MNLKMLFAKWRYFCIGIVLSDICSMDTVNCSMMINVENISMGLAHWKAAWNWRNPTYLHEENAVMPFVFIYFLKIVMIVPVILCLAHLLLFIEQYRPSLQNHWSCSFQRSNTYSNRDEHPGDTAVGSGSGQSPSGYSCWYIRFNRP